MTEPEKDPQTGSPGAGLLAPLQRLLGLKGAQMRFLQAALLLAAMGVALLLVAQPMGLTRQSVPVATAGGAAGGVAGGTVASAAATAPAGDLIAYEDALARRLEAILSHVAGAGSVRVQVTLASGPSQQVQVDASRTTSTIQEKDTSGGTRVTNNSEESSKTVLLPQGSGAEAPVVLRQQRPEVAGVLVVAEGAGDAGVRAELTRATSTALGISLNHIQVEEGR